MNTKFKRIQNNWSRKIQSILSPLTLQFKKQKQSLFFNIKLFWKTNKTIIVFQILILIIMMTFIRINLSSKATTIIPQSQPQYVEFETILTTEADLNTIASKIPYKRWREGKIVQIMTMEGPKFLIQVPKLSIENLQE